MRPNPARDVLPWVAAVVGVVQAVRGGIELAHGGSPVHLLIGLGLVVLGVVVGLVNRLGADGQVLGLDATVRLPMVAHAAV